MKGTCVKRTGSPIPLPDPYILHVQKNYYQQTELTANFSASLANAYSSLKTQIGYEKCTTTIPASLTLPLRIPSPIGLVASATPIISATAIVSITSLPLTTLTQDPVRGRHARIKEIIIISVVVPITVLIGISLCFVTIRKYRKKKRSQANGKDQRSLTSNSLIYVDRKAELEDEERRKHELDGCGISYEMEGEDRIFEMPGNEDSGTRSATLREIHELRGVEHSQELEGPGNNAT